MLDDVNDDDMAAADALVKQRNIAVPDNSEVTDDDVVAAEQLANRKLPSNLGQSLLTTVYNPQELSSNQRGTLMARQIGNVAKAFGQGYAEHGAENYSLSDETIKSLSDAHISKDFSDGSTHIGNGFMDGYFMPALDKMYGGFSRHVTLPAAQALKTAWVGLAEAPYEGAVSAAGETGIVDPGAVEFLALESGMPRPIFARPSLPREVAMQKASGALDGEDVFMGNKAPTDEQTAAMHEAASMYPEAEAVVATESQNVHEIARNINPVVFSKYDELKATRDNLAQQMRDLRDSHESNIVAQAPHNEEIAALEKKIQLGKRSRGEEGKIAELKAANEEWINSQGPSPELINLQEEYLKTDYALRDLAPEVSSAYREADTHVPKTEEPETVPVPEIKEPETVPAPDETAIHLQNQRSSIVTAEKQKLTDAVRPAEFADAEAELVAEHYLARAQRFKDGKGGTAEELYNRDSGEIRTSYAKGYRGKYRPAKSGERPITFLTGEQNATTYMHEKGHEWLDELIADSKHEHATDQVKSDVDAVLEYIKGEKDKPLSRASQEKFARGFERYLMEGVAPSKQLAKIFQQLKDWFTSIYKTADKLKAPISDDMRDVYARLLSHDPDRIVIAKDHEPVTVNAEINTVASAPEPVAEPSPLPVEGNVNTAPAEAPVPKPQNPVKEEGLADPSVISAKTKEPFLKKPGEYKAGNFRLENLTNNEDVRDIFRQADKDTGSFSAARRGVVSDVEVMSLAQAMGVSEKEVNLDKLRKLTALEDDVPLAVRIRVGREMMVQAAEDVRNIAGEVKASRTQENIVKFAESRRKFLMISETLSGVTEEWGRAGRAFQDISKEEMSGSEVIADLFQKKTGMTEEDLFQLANTINSADTSGKAAAALNNSKIPGIMDKVVEFRAAMMLFSPITNIKNIVGNSLMIARDLVETAVAGKISDLIGSGAVESQQAVEKIHSLNRGFTEGWATFKEAMADENAVMDKNRKFENKYQHAIEGKKGEYIRFSLRFLSATDALFKGINSRMKINELAFTMARDEGLSGAAFENRMAELIQSPTEEMFTKAAEFSDYQTLTNRLGPAAESFGKGIKDSEWFRFVVPFYRTNINSFKYEMADRQITGLFTQKMRDNLMGKNGAVERDMQIARLAVGSAFSATMIPIILNNRMTGSGPRDPVQRASWMQNHRPYSIRVGNSWYSYQWMQGIATPVGIIANSIEQMKFGEAKEADATKIFASTIGGVSAYMMDVTSLRSVSDFVKVLNQPEIYGENFVESMSSSFNPSLMRRFAMEIDPTVRDVHGLKEAIQNTVPIWRESLQPRVDVFGQTMKNETSLAIINPVNSGTSNNSPMLQRLQSVGYFPSPVDKKINGAELTDQQYHDYALVAGRLTKMALENVILRPGFETIPPGHQIKIMKDVVDNARKNARAQIMLMYPDINQRAMQAREKLLRTGHK